MSVEVTNDKRNLKVKALLFDVEEKLYVYTSMCACTPPPHTHIHTPYTTYLHIAGEKLCEALNQNRLVC